MAWSGYRWPTSRTTAARESGSVPGSAGWRTLTLGSQSYGKAELLALVNTRPNSSGSVDASLILAHQLIAAKLNVANGSDPGPVSNAITKSDALLSAFSGKLPYNVSRSSEQARSLVQAANILNDYNHGSLTTDCGL